MAHFLRSRLRMPVLVMHSEDDQIVPYVAAGPEITEARAEVEKASAGVRAAKREYIPNIEAYARYNYQENVPFLARNFGTFGVRFGYDVFDGGKKRATLRERDAQLAQARENLDIDTSGSSGQA